jgi:hypothetical protein
VLVGSGVGVAVLVGVGVSVGMGVLVGVSVMVKVGLGVLVGVGVGPFEISPPDPQASSAAMTTIATSTRIIRFLIPFITPPGFTAW